MIESPLPVFFNLTIGKAGGDFFFTDGIGKIPNTVSEEMTAKSATFGQK
jgi:hypothetical protein